MRPSFRDPRGGCRLSARLRVSVSLLAGLALLLPAVSAANDYENCTTYANTATAAASNAPDAQDGASVEFRVDNNGPGVAESETLQDSLPKGTAGSWAITTQPGGDPCSITNSELDKALGDLAHRQRFADRDLWEFGDQGGDRLGQLLHMRLLEMPVVGLAGLPLFDQHERVGFVNVTVKRAQRAARFGVGTLNGRSEGGNRLFGPALLDQHVDYHDKLCHGSSL